MGAFLIHLLGLGLVAAALRLWPRPRLSVLFLSWWIGIVLLRLAPGVISRLTPESAAMGPGSALLITLVEWIGAAVLLWGLIGLSQVDRPSQRRLVVYRWLFAGSFIFAGLAPKTIPVWFILAAPMLFSFRWRSRLGARGLIGASFTTFLCLITCVISFGRNPTDLHGVVPGLVPLPRLVLPLAVFYALAATPAAAGRIHLSIRKINRRLVSSHIIAGVVPFLLITLFLLLSGALFLSTYRGTVGTRILRDEAEQARSRIRQAVQSTGQVPLMPFGEASGQIVLAHPEGEAVRVLQGSPAFPADSLMAREDSSAATPLLWDGRTLYLRARQDGSASGRAWRVEALVPVDSLRMERISRILGQSTRISPHTSVSSQSGGVQIGLADDEGGSAAGADSAGARRAGSIGPARRHEGSLPGGAIASCLRWSHGHWSRSSIPIASSASLGEQILSLFSTGRENPLALAVIFVLGFLALLILGVIAVTVSVVLGMGRSITQAVRALTQAAGALGRGQFGHRIALEGRDELWDVAASFNDMARDLEKLRAVELESQRLEEELRLARQIQDRLFPSEPPILEKVELAGISLPAREVGGDYFDYYVLGNNQVAVAVADVSGKGAAAALLMSSFRAALRSQDLALLGPAEVLARINRFIHSSIDPGRFITAFLGLLDGNTGEFRYANAGHDPPPLVAADGSTRELTGGGLVLGLLPLIVYEEASAKIEPGSLIAIYTDGITEARDSEGEFFGPERLLEILKHEQSQSCESVQKSVVDAIRSFSASAAQYDDITLVLVRRK
jgi:serine phosphatase RsbU (regulator of sigma subunit)